MIIRLDKNSKKIIICLLLLTTVLALTCGLGLLAFDKALYLEIYVLLSVICFAITKDWISTLTLYWLQYTIYSLGYVFSKTVYLYNPFLIVLGSFALLLIGYQIGNMTNPLAIKKKRIKRCSFLKMKWLTTIIVMYMFSTFMWLLYIAKNRSFLFGGNLESGRVNAMSGNGLLLYSVMLHVMYIPLLYILLKRKEIHRTAFLALTIISCIELISVGYRTPLIISIFCILVINARLNRFDVKKAILYFGAMFLAAMLFEIFRAGGVFSISELLARFSSRFDVCMWNYNFIVSTFPDRVPFQYGYTNLIDLIMLLPGPGQDFSLWLKEAVGISFDGGGLVTFIQGSFYIDFGNVGLVIGMILLGLFKSRVDNKLAKSNFISFWGAYIPYAFSMVCGCVTGTFILPAVLFVVYKFMEHFSIGNIVLPRLDKKSIRLN